jgi:hypothetical protein
MFEGIGPFSDKLDVIILGVCASTSTGMKVNINRDVTTNTPILSARIITSQYPIT